MRLRYILALVVVAAVGVFLFPWRDRREATSGPQGPEPIASRPEEATYMIDGEAVTLSAGKAHRAGDGTATRIADIPFRADVDRSGLEDAVVIIERVPARGAVRSYIAAALRHGDEYTGTNAIQLGIDVRRQETAFEEWIIVQRYVDDGIARELRLQATQDGMLVIIPD